MFADKIQKGLEISISSLRNTNTNCRIILFIPNNIQLYPRHINFFRENNAELIRFEYNKNISPHILRYSCELDYLKDIKYFPARIVHIDSFDSFFQYDPFINVSYSSITFTGEGYLIKQCKWNKKWIRSCFDEKTLKELWGNEIICSGSIYGSANEYKKFLEVLIKQNKIYSCNMPSLDQALVNYLVYSNFLKNQSIKYSISSCSGNAISMAKCMHNSDMLVNSNQQFLGISNNVPAILHQYDRYPAFKREIDHLCYY